MSDLSQDAVIRALLNGGIFSVEDEPTITLIHWAIMEATFLDGTTSAHFAGEQYGDGRASSRIECFDPVTKSGKTKSGRLYKCDGEPGLTDFCGRHSGEYIWHRWCHINGVVSYRDITARVFGQETECPITECDCEQY